MGDIFKNNYNINKAIMINDHDIHNDQYNNNIDNTVAIILINHGIECLCIFKIVCCSVTILKHNIDIIHYFIFEIIYDLITISYKSRTY